MGWEIMNNSPYSPDLVPSDFHMSGPMKVHLQKHKFQTDDGGKRGARTGYAVKIKACMMLASVAY
jgi:hypothetical protein